MWHWGIFCFVAIFFGTGAQAVELNRPSFSNSDYLRLYFYIPVVPFDFTSPESLAWSGFKAVTADEIDYSVPPTFTDEKPFGRQIHYKMIPAIHSIGHTNVNVHCVGEPEHWSGETDDDNSTTEDMVLHGAGMEATFLTLYGSGYLFSRQQIVEQLNQFYLSGRVASLTIKVSHQSCERMLQYASEYKARGYEKIFGGILARPRYGEGAGCTAYGLSFMEIAGLMTPKLHDEFSYNLNVPRQYLGHYPEEKPSDYNALGLIFHGMLGDGGTRWATENEPHLHINFYDPELAFTWVQTVYAQAMGTATSGSKAINPYPVVDAYQIGKTQHIVVDATNAPTPTEALWLDPKTDPAPTW